MRCDYCGKSTFGKFTFCPSCGREKNPVGCKELLEDGKASLEFLTCEKCGSNMEVDPNKPIIACPYCGSKKLVVENDSVKIQKLKSDAYVNSTLGVQQAKAYAEVELAKIKNEQDKRVLYSFLGLIILFLLLMLAMRVLY